MRYDAGGPWLGQEMQFNPLRRREFITRGTSAWSRRFRPPDLAATRKNRAFCDANTTFDNFFGSLRLAAPQLSQSLFTKQECTQDPVPMHEWSGSQIPDMAPYIEWLAIVCSLNGGTVLFSHGVLT